MNFLMDLRKKCKNYIYDSSIDIRDRSFILFSIAVLIALFVAIPCGMIMREPFTATISTFVGAVFFSIYVIYSYKSNTIKRARIIISFILVFGFLPAMFFTNGGVYGGTPIWLLLGTVYITLILDGRFKFIMLSLNFIVNIITWVVGYYHPEFVTTYSDWGNYYDSIAGLFIVSLIVFVLFSFQYNLFRNEEEQKNVRRLFEQTAMALVNAIDAKDKYTHGHSSRVAEYSYMIAEYAGLSHKECDEIYHIALLHDVGKIGIDESIINKPGKLTREEFETIKQHPVLGSQILDSINEYPGLSIGARYHHERYDGKGYPEGLKGEDIPEIARIISVADAYDAMTSKRSYREAIPQQTVREEIVKGTGTQFDPKYAKIMQHLIDLDSEYKMKEMAEVKELEGKSELICKEFRSDISKGIWLTQEIKHIRFSCEPTERQSGNGLPAIILFDSLDGRYHENEFDVKNLCYFEYGVIWFDGRTQCNGARKIKVEDTLSIRQGNTSEDKNIDFYEIDAVKCDDHILIVVDNGIKKYSFTVALPDSSRFAYIGVTGERCRIFDVSIESEKEPIFDDYIPRIAERISYINVPNGDLENIQIDGYRTVSTKGVSITDGMKITFHTMSLPTSRLIWHCPYIDIFYSANRESEGDDYKEYALIRLDGENWEAIGVATNKLNVIKNDDFVSWEQWKEANKKGYDCTLTFSRHDNVITTVTENCGISIKNETTIIESADDVYVSLSGDQCALTNIRIER